jgi:ElaB/YqjD/DUF883 family membrane-anchored ribosome-binding protein
MTMENNPMSSRAGQTSGTPAQPGSDFGKAGAVAQDTLSTVQHTADHALDQVREQGKHQIAGQKDQVAGTIGDVAHAMRQTGQQLRQGNQDAVAQFMDQAANQLEDFSQSLRHKSVDELVREAEGFARRQPALFLGGAFMLGLFAARFLKSSPPAPYGMNGEFSSRYGDRIGFNDGNGYRMGSAYGTGRSMGMESGAGAEVHPYPRSPQASIYDQPGPAATDPRTPNNY